MKNHHKKSVKETKKHWFPERKDKEGVSVKKLFLDSLNIPEEIQTKSAVLTLKGNSNLYIENHKGIIEYTEEMLKIQVHERTIQIEGSHLNVVYFTDDNMEVEGYIHSIKYA